MTSSDLLVDAFARVKEIVDSTVHGLPLEQLTFRIDPDANSIAWLIWHLTRVQDDHIADAAGIDQAWLAKGWEDRFGLPLDRRDTGYAHSSNEVAVVTPSAELLTGYHADVHEQTIEYVGRLTDDDLPRIVDTNWDPPVTLGVRLVSVIGDTTQHAGQAAFIRGVLERTHPI